MSTEHQKSDQAFAERLEVFDDQLHSSADDVSMLAEIQDSIGQLLADSSNSESAIRRVLQERYEAGALRKETFQLVKSMLDRYVTEKIPTSPTPDDAPVYEKTLVLGDKPLHEVIEEVETVDFDFGAVDEPEADAEKPDFGSTTVIPEDAFTTKTADELVQVGSVLRDRFVLQERVAGGSMGVVYKALDRRLAEAGSDSHWVAIKILSPQLARNANALRALQQEASKGRCLVHPHIVRFIDIDRDEDLYFIVMEWMEGRTLADILDSGDRDVIDLKASFRIVRQIGDALDYAHRCGIVHADIKPANIMIMPNGDAKLFDFGVARVRQNQADGGFDPGVLGAMTPAYSSMQVLTGEDPVGSDDVFSLGCLLYRLVAGYRVFGPRNAAEASQEGMKPQRPKGIGDAEWKALKKALAYSRVTRFASVREFLDALDEEEARESTISIEAPERFIEQESQGVGRAIFLILLLLAALGVGAWQLGYLDPYIEQYAGETNPTPVIHANDTPALPVPATVAEASEELVQEPDPAPVAEEPEAIVDEQPEPVADAAVSAVEVVEQEDPDAVGPALNLTDWSTLPPANLVVPLSLESPDPEPNYVILREDTPETIIDFVRDGDITQPLTLRLEESGFSGNRSPWSAGQFAMSNSGVIHFPVGEKRARLGFRMAPDSYREPDQVSRLRIRLIDDATSVAGRLDVELQDDDQRSFESNLPIDTIAFATDSVTVDESEPAFQVDLVRYNAGGGPLEVAVTVSDIMATDGEDYFAPGASTVSFAPRQRTARVLIPLVQDSMLEGNETFVLELSGDPNLSLRGAYQRLLVTIRDDEAQSP